MNIINQLYKLQLFNYKMTEYVTFIDLTTRKPFNIPSFILAELKHKLNNLKVNTTLVDKGNIQITYHINDIIGIEIANKAYTTNLATLKCFVFLKIGQFR